MKIKSLEKKHKVSSVLEHDAIRAIASELDQGRTVFFPVSTDEREELREVLFTHIQNTSNTEITQINNVVVNTVKIDPTLKEELNKDEIVLGGVSVSRDIVKGAVVGGGVAGLILSLTDSAKSIGPVIGLAASCIALGSVLFPDVAERIRDSEWIIGKDGVTIKPP